MAEKKTYYVNNKQKKAKKPDKHAYGNQCVYCAKKLNTDAPESEKIYAQATTRKFPVCSEECKKATEEYVAADKRHKIHFYWMFMVCMFLTLGGALFDKWMIVFPGVIIGGLSFLIFPYPISSFETFLNYSIRGMTRLIRVIGLIFTAAGIFFTVCSILGITEISFY